MIVTVYVCVIAVFKCANSYCFVDVYLHGGFKVSAPAIECQNHVQQPRDSQRQEIVQQPRKAQPVVRRTV